MKKVPLTQGQVALVDDADYERVMEHKWYAGKRRDGFHALTNIPLLESRNGKHQKTVTMHGFIMGTENGEPVDHINHDSLDNRRSNLRKCTPAENSRNRLVPDMPKTSRFKGVNRDTRPRKTHCAPIWRAAISYKGKQRHLGCFGSEAAAAVAYDKAALDLFGEFALTNFPKEVYH